MALAAIGTVICRKEVASEPPRLPRLCFEAVGVTSPAGSLHIEVTSSSLKLTRRVFFPLLVLVGLGFEPTTPGEAIGDGKVAVGCLFTNATVTAVLLSAVATAETADVSCGSASAESTISVAFSPSKLLKLAEGDILGVGWMTFMSMD